MIPHRDEHLDLCAALVAGSIDEADRLELERHLTSGCAECERALAGFAEGAVLLAAAAPPVTPPASVRAAVLERVRAEAAGTPVGGSDARAPGLAPSGRGVVLPMPAARRPAWPSWALAAAAAVLAVTTFVLWRQSEDLKTELAGVQGRITQTERELAEERAWAAVLANPANRVADFAPTPAAFQVPRVRATYDPKSRRAIVAFEGATPPGGKDYELWAILPDGPKSLGVVHADASGHAEVRVPDAGDPAALQAFAVSLEATGGSPDPRKPAGPVILVGAIKS